MSATGAGYDLSVTTFSPDGRVFQVEYANKAVEKSGTALGIRCRDGVVLGVEKPILSKMLVESSNRRILTVDLHAGVTMSGLSADGKQLVNRARSEAQSYRSFYGQPIPCNVLADRLAGFVHMYTLYWYLRPFGVSVLLVSYDPQDGPADDSSKGPQLYMLEPSGLCYRYHGCAIGKHRMGAKTELEKIKFESITCREAVNEIAKIIYNLHDDVKDKEFELEMSWVCDESERKHVPVPENLRSEAIRLAVDAKEKAEMDDSDDDDDKDSKKPKLGEPKLGEPKQNVTVVAPH